MTPAEETAILRMEGKIDLLSQRFDSHEASHRAIANWLKWGAMFIVAAAAAAPKVFEMLGNLIQVASAGVLS